MDAPPEQFFQEHGVAVPFAKSGMNSVDDAQAWPEPDLSLVSSERIAPPEYPSHCEVRRVSHAGTFRFHSDQLFLTQALNGEHIGLEEVEDGLWNLLYYDTLLGRLDEHNLTITGAPSLRRGC